MRFQVSSKSLAIFIVLALALTLVLFFSMRFVRQGTAIESDSDEPASPSTVSANTLDKNPSDQQKTPDRPEPPPDRTIKELVSTWNQGNAEDIAGLFSSDGTLVIPTGSELRSRAEIAKTISEKRAGMLKETTLTNTVEKVSQPDPETAVVQGTYKLDGIKIMGFSTSATGSYILRQIKREGRWLISRAEVTKGNNG
jgi:uncharacterized protein (TIGR02246 family)